jgi:hypothetical protein
MHDFELYLWVVAGVLGSFALPMIWKAAFPGVPVPSAVVRVSRLWAETKPYLLIALASSVLGLVAFAIVKTSGGKFDHWYSAFLNGYFWDATLQKFKR